MTAMGEEKGEGEDVGEVEEVGEEVEGTTKTKTAQIKTHLPPKGTLNQEGKLLSLFKMNKETQLQHPLRQTLRLHLTNSLTRRIPNLFKLPRREVTTTTETTVGTSRGTTTEGTNRETTTETTEVTKRETTAGTTTTETTATRATVGRGITTTRTGTATSSAETGTKGATTTATTSKETTKGVQETTALDSNENPLCLSLLPSRL